MQTIIQKSTFVLLTFIFTAFFSAPVNGADSSNPAAPACGCDAPGVSLTGQTQTSATFGIETPSGEVQYHYVNKSTNASSGTITTSSSSVTIGGLAPGHYDVYFRSICPGEGVSEYIIVDIIM
jgi:hypothetical protein